MDQMNAITQINAERQAWLQARRAGIGGSDVAALLGLSKYNSPYSLWLDKTGRGTDDTSGEAALWGQLNEDMIARQFALRTGLKVQRINSILRGTEDWMLGNIDRAIINPAISGNVRIKADGGSLTTDQILEVKTSSQYLDKLWGESVDSVPDHYLTQCQWYLGITQVEVCHLAVLIGGNKMRQYKISRDDELIAMLKSEARTFWHDYVLADQPPEPTTFDDLAHRFGQHAEGSVLEADDDLAVLISEYKALGEAIKEAKENQDDMKLDIVKAMRDAEMIMHDGKKLLTYKTQTSNRIDSAAFKKAHPDLSEAFTKTSTSRVLRLA
jgi:putative phage-type endonuclease